MNPELYMRRCFDLARKGAGKVAPNPLVGAVLVYNNRIIGEGYHTYYGGPHAEVNCINSVAEQDQILIAQSCLYVNLEPCAHFGKTPPCAHLVVASGIKQVVIANRDPFEQVNGNGIAYLEKNGVEVTCGLLEKEGLALNKVFFTNTIKKRPYIYLKWAETSDGFVGNSKQRVPISNPLHKLWMQQVRAQIPSILVGRNTVSVNHHISCSSQYRAGCTDGHVLKRHIVRTIQTNHIVITGNGSGSILQNGSRFRSTIERKLERSQTR